MPPCHLAKLITVALAGVAYAKLELKDRSCSCLSWSEVYTPGKGAVCGQALEYLRSTDPGPHAVPSTDPGLKVARNSEPLGHLCREFFQRFGGNQCVNQMRDLQPEDSNKWYAGSWCYVSNGCPDLGGGERVPGTRLSWKGCQADKDTSLRDLTPEEIIDVSAEHDLDASFLFQYAYFTKGQDPNSLTELELQTIRGSNLPTMLLPAKKATPRMLVVKNQYWSLEEDLKYRDPQHPGTFWRWSMLKGEHEL